MACLLSRREGAVQEPAAAAGGSSASGDLRQSEAEWKALSFDTLELVQVKADGIGSLISKAPRGLLPFSLVADEDKCIINTPHRAPGPQKAPLEGQSSPPAKQAPSLHKQGEFSIEERLKALERAVAAPNAESAQRSLNALPTQLVRATPEEEQIHKAKILNAATAAELKILLTMKGQRGNGGHEEPVELAKSAPDAGGFFQWESQQRR